MTEILETMMLVCFGLSWPLNVYRNVKAKTAKGMSIFFILLIITGYIAGISAKIVNHNFTYVFAVYIINLVIVSINVPVYFRNKACDRRREEIERMASPEKVETIKVDKDAKLGA